MAERRGARNALLGYHGVHSRLASNFLLFDGLSYVLAAMELILSQTFFFLIFGWSVLELAVEDEWAFLISHVWLGVVCLIRAGFTMSSLWRRDLDECFVEV